jgi:multiple sugar transport system substrate-binding protein
VRSTRKRTSTVATALGLSLALLLPACGFGDDDSDSDGGDSGDGGGSATLDLLVPTYSDAETNPPGTKARWEEIIEGFEAENSDITVNLEVQSWDDINNVIKTKLQSDQAPDILNIDAYASFAGDDLLYPAEEVVSPETLEDFEPSFAENASLDGTMYGLPFIASARVLFYNKDLFQQAGIQEPPATWEEFEEAARKLADLPGDVAAYGMPLGSEEAQAETSVWTFGNGGSWGDTEELTINTPENLEAVEYMKHLIDEGLTQDDPGASDRTPLLNVFYQGKIGMMVGLPPTVTEIEANYPELNYGTAPLPTVDGEPVTLGVADHLMAFKNDESKTEAIKAFLDYFFSVDVYTKFVDEEGFLPTTVSGAESLADKQEIKPFLELLPAAQFYPSNNPNWATAQGALQQQIGTIGQGADPAEVLDQIAAAAEGGF